MNESDQKVEEVLRALDQSCFMCRTVNYVCWPLEKEDMPKICFKHLWDLRNSSLIIDCRIACEQELKRRDRIP